MRGLGGLLLLAGICVGLFVYFPAPVDRDTSLSQATRANETRVALTPPPKVVTAVAPAPVRVSRLANFSPSRKLVMAPPRVQAAPSATAVPVALTQASQVEGWQANVSPTAAGTGALEPTDPEGRYK